MFMDLATKTIFVQALRDFFLAKNGKDMSLSLENLQFYKHNTNITKDEQRLLKLEYAFNRLFIGPDKVLAPPFASIYLDNEPVLKGKSAQEIEKLLLDLGLDFDNSSNLPADHISIELEIWLVVSNIYENLLVKKESLDKNSTEYADILELLENIKKYSTWLNKEHMPVWIAEFIQRIQNAPKELENLGENVETDDVLTEEILYIVNCLEAWLNSYTSKK